MGDEGRGLDRAGRWRKRFLTPQEKYEIWLQLVRRESTIAEAAQRAGVDPATVMKLRDVAKRGALDALAASRPPGSPPGHGPRTRREAEIVRLTKALTETVFASCCLRGKGAGAEWWPGPAPGRCGHQAGAPGGDRPGP